MYPSEPLHLEAIIDGRIFFKMILGAHYFLYEWITCIVNLLDLLLSFEAHVACFCRQSRAFAHFERPVYGLIFFY
jgi:hypothetical protein